MRKLLFGLVVVLAFWSLDATQQQAHAQRACRSAYDHWLDVSLNTILPLFSVKLSEQGSRLYLNGDTTEIGRALEEKSVSELAEYMLSIGQWFTALETEFAAGTAVLDCATPATLKACDALFAVFERRLDIVAREQKGFETMMDELRVRRTTDRPELLHGAYRTVIVNARNTIDAHTEFEPVSGNYYRCRIGMAYIDNWTGGPNLVGPNGALGFSGNE